MAKNLLHLVPERPRIALRAKQRVRALMVMCELPLSQGELDQFTTTGEVTQTLAGIQLDIRDR